MALALELEQDVTQIVFTLASNAIAGVIGYMTND